MHIMLGLDADTGDEIRFVHAHGTSFVLGLLTTAGAAAAWIFMGPGTNRLLFAGGLALVAGRNLLQALQRHELVLDLPGRRWWRTKGLAFAPSTEQGSLDDLDGVVLTVVVTTVGSGSSRRQVTTFLLALEFAGPAWDDRIIVDMLQEEAAAYARLEEWAHRLRVDAVDRTGERDVGRAWDALDRPLAEAEDTGARGAGAGTGTLAPTAPALAPSSGSGIETTVVDGRRRITLPPAGHGAATVFSMVFGLVFGSFGAFMLAWGLGLLGPITSTRDLESEPALLVALVSSAFIFSAGAMVRAASRRSRTRQWVREERHRLVFGDTRGTDSRELAAVAKGEVEEVAVRADAHPASELRVLGFPVGGSAEAVRVRSDTEIVRIGRQLSPEGKLWLRDALEEMVRE